MKPETACNVYLYMSCDLVSKNFRHLYAICRLFSTFAWFAAKIQVSEFRKKVNQTTQAVKFDGTSFKTGPGNLKCTQKKLWKCCHDNPIRVTWPSQITHVCSAWCAISTVNNVTLNVSQLTLFYYKYSNCHIISKLLFCHARIEKQWNVNVRDV